MIKIQNKTLQELQNNSYHHNLESPVWLFKIEKLFHKGSFYLKLYLIHNMDVSNLNAVRVCIDFKETNFEVDIVEFKKAESYPKDPIFGCLVKLPPEFNDDEYTVELVSLIKDNKRILLDPSKVIPIDFKLDERNTELNKYLVEHIPNFQQFPSIYEDYWQCSCGKYNSVDLCQNCGQSQNRIKEMISTNLESLFIQTYLEHTPFKPNLKQSYDTNLNQYFEPLKKMGYTIEDADKFGIDQAEIEPQITQYQAKYKKKRNLTLLIMTGLMIVAGITLALNWKTIRISTASNYFEKGEFEKAKEIFQELNDPEFSDEIANCEMEIAHQLYQEGKLEEAYELAKSNVLKSSDESYREDYKEIKYNYAVSIYDSKDGNALLFELDNYKKARYYALLYLIEDYFEQYTRYQRGDDINTIEYAMWSTQYSSPDLLYNEIKNYPEFSRDILEWQFFRYTLEGTWKDRDGNYFKMDSEGTTQYYVPFTVKDRYPYKYYFYYNDGYYYGNDVPVLKVLTLKLWGLNSLEICNLEYDCVTLDRKQ